MRVDAEALIADIFPPRFRARFKIYFSPPPQSAMRFQPRVLYCRVRQDDISPTGVSFTPSLPLIYYYYYFGTADDLFIPFR